AARGRDLAAGDRDADGRDAEAVGGIVYVRNCAAGDVQNAVAGDGDISIGAINTKAGVDLVCVVVNRARDRVLAYQFNGKTGFTVDGSRFVVKKHIRILRNLRAVEGQGFAVPFDIIVVLSGARDHHRAVRIRQGV